MRRHPFVVAVLPCLVIYLPPVCVCACRLRGGHAPIPSPNYTPCPPHVCVTNERPSNLDCLPLIASPLPTTNNRRHHQLSCRSRTASFLPARTPTPSRYLVPLLCWLTAHTKVFHYLRSRAVSRITRPSILHYDLLALQVRSALPPRRRDISYRFPFSSSVEAFSKRCTGTPLSRPGRCWQPLPTAQLTWCWLHSRRIGRSQG